MIAVARASHIEQKDADVGRPQQAHHYSDRLLAIDEINSSYGVTDTS